MGAVLAGGGSRRMGTSKALLRWDGVPLVARVAGALAEAVEEVVVVARRPAELRGLGLQVVEDEPGPQTPLSGVRTALRLAAARPLFVAACDMPFLSPAFVHELLLLGEGHEVVVPLHHDRPEPLHAVWLPSSLGQVESSLESGRPAVRDVLARLDVRWVTEQEWRCWDPEGRSLVNLNTPQDVERERRSGPAAE
jgi:molybdopterin-guanine dinucleotide biosynthesis protein A